MINAFLRSVDLEAFRTGKVDEDSSVASARAALITYADVAHRWLTAALEADTELSEELRAELAQCLEYFGKNLDIIALYESESEIDDELKKPRWADICDIVVYAFNIAYAPLDRAAGGIQPHLRIFEAQITGGDIPEGTSRKAILVDDEAPGV
ncbi:uncharacterized protein LAESUDRAFT_729617 [Laetiporus sulphureus 93-53]|uniref:Uncharacterized protein n=1 Tax=Laetiporus sulphureus 93-53 TaxID=1314785 RepID=A0A165CMW9_9APHY|nr:uncharacterized protein LAESUDRAFT_729617 [Laetiporus sulphureus 93-53]KZT03102.1 hypothetical protein LAESUDRAFT_729617 [Laetiporus sulphureus 93-53]